MGALKALGHTPFKIAQILGRSRNTIAKYLSSELFRDPDFEKKVELIKEREVLDLYSLGAKARLHLDDMITKGALSPLESIALMDRSFQQRRLLEGRSTENVASLTKIIQAAHENVLPKKEIENAPDSDFPK